MNQNIHGDFMYKGKFYTWHYTPVPHRLMVWNSQHTEICRFEIELSLLWNKRGLIERCKQQIEKKERKENTIDWDGVDEV